MLRASPRRGPVALPQLAISVGACLVAVWVGVRLTQSPYAVLVYLLAILYLLTLAVNFRLLTWLIVALQPAALIVPFLNGRPFFWELCALLAWPSLMAYFLTNRSRFESLQLDLGERRAMLALGGYLVVLVVLMMAHGVGFRSLGGGQMGGRFYVQQVVIAIVPLLLLAADFSRRTTLWLVGASWLMSLTYLVSDFALSSGNPVLGWLLYFFELPTDALNFEQAYEVTGMRRFQSLATCATTALSLLWTLFPLRSLLGRGGLLGVPVMLGCLGVGLGSGHRTILIISVSAFLLLTIFQRYWTPLRLCVAVCVGMACLGALYTTAEDLPISIQRSVSFLPGIHVSPLARDDALATLSDRIEVLKLAVGDISRYWLLGRGFGIERLDQLPVDEAYAGIWLQYMNGFFYNGTLGLLLKTGLPGFTVALLFLWYVSRSAVDLVRLVRFRDIAVQDAFDRLCLLLSAYWFSFLFFFLFTHGDAATWMQLFVFPAALILLCRRRQLERATEAS